jgi:hypothetical protein
MIAGADSINDLDVLRIPRSTTGPPSPPAAAPVRFSVTARQLREGTPDVLVGEEFGEEIDRDAAAAVLVGCQWQAGRPGLGEPIEGFACCRPTGDPSSSF